MKKKIDIAAILKDCPRGMELDSPMFEGLEFDSIVNSDYFSIRCRIKHPDGGYNYNFTKYGCWTDAPFSKCVIFPKGKTTWDGFKPPCKFKDGDVITCTNSVCSFVAIFKKMYTDTTFLRYVTLTLDDEQLGIKDSWSDFKNPRFATEEEKEKLFQAIKKRGYKWNAETKTLEKLVEPKFKVGDRIRSVISLSYYTIVDIKDDQYVIQPDEPEKFPYHIDFSLETNYELVHKFDITTLKPFESKVLVRDKNTDEWRGHFFSHYDSNSDRPYVCIGVEGINEYKRCIPYKDNEHLLGKTDDCSSFYKTWE